MRYTGSESIPVSAPEAEPLPVLDALHSTRPAATCLPSRSPMRSSGPSRCGVRGPTAATSRGGLGCGHDPEVKRRSPPGTWKAGIGPTAAGGRRSWPPRRVRTDWPILIPGRRAPGPHIAEAPVDLPGAAQRGRCPQPPAGQLDLRRGPAAHPGRASPRRGHDAAPLYSGHETRCELLDCPGIDDHALLPLAYPARGRWRNPGAARSGKSSLESVGSHPSGPEL